MRKMKYIVFENRDGDESLYLFPESKTHDEFSKVFAYLKPVRAGFVSMGDDDKLYCNGESISLKLRSDSFKDNMLLYRQLGQGFFT